MDGNKFSITKKDIKTGAKHSTTIANVNLHIYKMQKFHMGISGSAHMLEYRPRSSILREKQGAWQGRKDVGLWCTVPSVPQSNRVQGIGHWRFTEECQVLSVTQVGLKRA